MLLELHKYSYMTSSTNGGSKVSNLSRTKTIYKVFQRYYWPGIFNNIEQVVSFIIATQLQLYFMHVRNLWRMHLVINVYVDYIVVAYISDCFEH